MILQNSNSKEDLSELKIIFQTQWTPLFEKEPIDFVYLGGSVVTKTQLSWSDIDIFIGLSAASQLEKVDLMKYLFDLQDHCGNSSNQMPQEFQN